MKPEVLKMTDADKEEFIHLARKRFQMGLDADRTSRERYTQAMAFKWGDQWPDYAKEARKGRPCFTLNKVIEKCELAKGEYLQSEPGISVKAVDSMADQAVAEIFEGHIRAVENSSRAKQAYGKAFENTDSCGRGAWRYNLKQSDENPFWREATVERILNTLTVVSDPNAMQLDRSDAKWVFVTSWISKEEHEDEFPGKNLSGWIFDDTDQEEDWRSTEKGVRVCEYWFKKKRTEKRYQVERDGKKYVLEERHLSEVLETDQLLDETEVEVNDVYHCRINGQEILDQVEKWPGHYIPIIESIGREDFVGNERVTEGRVYPSMDAQRMYNFWASASTESTALGPKQPIFVTPKMIENHEAMWNGMNKENRNFLFYNPDPLNPQAKPFREAPSQPTTGYAAEMDRMERDINSAMCTHPPQLGMESNEISGRAIIARNKAGSATSYGYVWNFERALEYGYTVLLDLIQNLHHMERPVRTLAEDGTEGSVEVNVSLSDPEYEKKKMLRDKQEAQGIVPDVPFSKSPSGFINDITSGRFDVVVTIGPSFTTQREEAAEQMVRLAAVTPPDKMANAIDLLYASADFRGSDKWAERMKKQIPSSIRGLDPGEQPPPPPPPHPMMIIEENKLKIEVAKLVLKAMEAEPAAILKLAQAEALEQGTQLDVYRSFLDTMGLKFQQIPQQVQGAGQIPQEQLMQDPLQMVGPGGEAAGGTVQR